MKQLMLEPIKHVEGSITIPGSKSLSNRALLLAALAEGVTVLDNVLKSDDTRYMIQALQKLGVGLRQEGDTDRYIVEGNGAPFRHDDAIELYLGNAGTAMRPLAAALTLGKGTYILTGEPRMKERPIGHLVDALRQAGANGIRYLENEGYPPLRIVAEGLQGGEVSIDGSLSSQFLTALLMAAPYAQQPIRVVIQGELVSKPYIDITLDLMQRFGIEVKHERYRYFDIPTGRYRSPGRYVVEGDASGASYFLAAAAIKGGRVEVRGIGKDSIQGDIAFANVLEKMGAVVEWGEEFVAVSRGKLQAVDMDFNAIPDAAMTIAAMALFAKGTTVLRNIYNWRVKETDRLSAMATELRKTGAVVKEGEDYLAITPPKTIRHAVIDTYNDHRMAMAFSLLALSSAGVTINDPGCTAKTFPNYFDLFERIAKR